MNSEDHFEIEIQNSCDYVRKQLLQRAYDDCEQRIIYMIERFPHNPEPYNLLGIVLEQRGEHLLALKHFRVALSLNPSYAPAIHNLETYATLFSHGSYAIDESDCQVLEIQKVESEAKASKTMCNEEDR